MKSKKLFAILMAIAMLLSVVPLGGLPTVVAANLPGDVQYFGGHAYKLFDDSLSWTAAQEACEEEGGHLVTINSQSEQDFLIELAKSSSKKNLWIGAKANSAGVYSWVTDEPFTYTNWASGEPNNVFDTQYTAMMYTQKASYSAGLWNDENENGRSWTGYYLSDFGFVCEWDLQYVLGISNSEHIIKVVDSAGNPIENATVTLSRSGQIYTYNTEDKGYVIFGKTSIGDIDFVVTADDYEEYTTVGKNFTISESGCDIIVLYTKEEAGLKLTEAIYQDTTSSYDEVIGKDVNLVKGTKRLSYSNASAGYFRILCKTSDASKAGRYILYQNGKIIQKCADGVFNLKISQFDVGKNIYVTVLGENNNKVTTELNLEICDDTQIEHFTFSVGEKLSVAVPDAVPYIGGTTVNVDIPDLPIDFVLENGKLYAGLNVDFEVSKTGFKATKSMAEQYGELKETLEDLRTVSGYQVDGQLKDKVDNLLKKRDSFNLPAAGSIEGTIFGGGEATWTEKGVEKLEISAYVLIDFKGEKGWQTFWGYIPVFFSFEVGVEAKTPLNLSWNNITKSLVGDTQLTIRPHLEADGGVGINGVIEGKAYGSADVDVNIQLIGTTVSPGVNSVSITGELGVKGCAGPFGTSIPFYHNTWPIYTRTDAVKRMRATQSATYDWFNAQLYNIENYTLSDISYLEKQSQWMGERKWYASRLTSGTESGYVQFRTLLTDTYRNMQPVMATSAEDVVMAFVGADTDREAQNVGTAMYSVYNAETASWSQPMKLDDNNTADYAPFVYSDDNEIRLVYQDAAIEYGDNLSYEEYLSTQNIVVYVFDKETHTFILESTFVSNDDYYRTPKLTDVNGTPALVWIAGEGTDLFGQGGSNKILCSYFVDGIWSEPVALAEGLPAVCDYAVGNADNELNVLYVVDGDNDLVTGDDRTLVLLSESGNNILSEGTATNLSFVQLPSESKQTFIWISNGVLKTLTTSSEIKDIGRIGSVESITVVNDKILFTGSGDGNSEIFAIVYDEENDSYGKPVQLSSQDKYVEELSGVNFNGTDILIMTRKDVTITEEDVIDDCEFSWAILNSRSDLKVNSIEYDYDDIEDGCIPLYVSVSNNGTLVADQYAISVKNVASDVLAAEQFDEPLLAGESKDIVIMLPLENVTTLTDLTMSIGESFEQEHHSSSFEIGYADLVVYTETVTIGSQNTLVCTIVNEGLSPASGKLSVFEGSEDNLLSAGTIETLNPGEKKTFVVEFANLTGEHVVTCAVESDDEEYRESNNTETVYLDFSAFEEAECQHVYGDWVETAPTCGEAGKRERECVCGYIHVEGIPATGEHIYDSDSDEQCNNCGSVRGALLSVDDFEDVQLHEMNAYQETAISEIAAYTGVYGLQLKGSGGWDALANHYVETVPGQKYALSFWVKVNSSGVNLVVKDDAAETNLINKYLSVSQYAEWTYYETEFVAASARILINFAGNGIGQVEDVYIDDMCLTTVVLSGGKTSISEDVHGLAFKFDVVANDGRVFNGNQYVNGSAQAFVGITGKERKVVRMGAVVSNQSDVVLNLESVNGRTTIDIPAVYLCELDETSLSYAVRIINIPESGWNTEIHARPYLVYEVDGKEVVLYGDVASQSYGALSTAFTFEDGTTSDWKASNAASISAVTDAGGSGSYCLRFDTTYVDYGYTYVNLPVDANTEYKVSFWMKSNATYAVGVRFLSSGWAEVDAEKVSPTNEWREYTVTLNSGDNTQVLLMLQPNISASAGQIFWFDNITCTPC